MEERLEVALKHAAENLGIKQCSYIRQQSNDTIANYFGILIPVIIKGNGSEQAVQKSVFVKLAVTDINEQLASVMKRVYDVEVYVYTTLFPIYKTLSKLDLSDFFPECYYASLEERKQVLVLSDMRSKGFQRYVKSQYLDVEHTTICLKALAKFHALSIFYKQKINDFNKEIFKPYSGQHPMIYQIYIKEALQRHMHLFVGTAYEHYLKYIESYLDFHNIRACSEVKYLIYGHGDFMRENMLFKYENSKPVQVCMLDMQHCRIMSPAQDIIQFLVPNVATDDLFQYHKHFLNVYLDELHMILKDNGFNYTYSKKDLNHDIKVAIPCSLSINLMVLSLSLGLEDGNILESKNKCDSNGKPAAQILYKNRVVSILDYLDGVNCIDLIRDDYKS